MQFDSWYLSLMGISRVVDASVILLEDRVLRSLNFARKCPSVPSYTMYLGNV